MGRPTPLIVTPEYSQPVNLLRYGRDVALTQLLPVSLAGWGVREAALVVALGSFGIPAEGALAISILMGLCMILTGLPGGLIWLAGWDIARPRLSLSPTSHLEVR